ncbi:SDR family NAD(P)-dependent oxidoreductase [Streptomyces sp. HMX112]|uniref:SDR family NAD(P)-dependent oxidoreductase n=1 Tax=Streptomyces sp. HMX112 TaxID=3390850 RepID=UPI003A801B72
MRIRPAPRPCAAPHRTAPLAIRLADLGAEIFLSARDLTAAQRVRDEIRNRGHQRVHAFACDLTNPASIRDFASSVAEHTDRIDLRERSARIGDGTCSSRGRRMARRGYFCR